MLENVGNLFGGKSIPQFPLIYWKRFTQILGNGEPVLISPGWRLRRLRPALELAGPLLLFLFINIKYSSPSYPFTPQVYCFPTLYIRELAHFQVPQSPLVPQSSKFPCPFFRNWPKNPLFCRKSLFWGFIFWVRLRIWLAPKLRAAPQTPAVATH